MPMSTKDLQREYQRNWIKKRRISWLREKGPCVKCGSWKNLEIDHKDRTKKSSHRVWSWAKKRRDIELSKCQVLCRQCHREKSTKEISKPLIHGTRSGYQKGCRCIGCTKATVDYTNEWRWKTGRRKMRSSSTSRTPPC